MFELCREHCDRDERCRCWSFVESTCFLKDDFFKRIPREGAVSGTKLPQPPVEWNAQDQQQQQQQQQQLQMR